MKVAILTLHNSPNNAGAVLQAWALQQAVAELGYEACVIDYHRKRGDMVPWWSFNSLRGAYYTVKRTPFEALRLHKCSQFLKHNLKLEGTQYGGRVNYRDADAFIVGSDQVFNPVHNEMNPDFLLDFVPLNRKRVAYGASFGTDVFSKEYEVMLKRCLPKFAALSVRENAGVDVVRKIVGMDASVVLDPTLLHKADEYEPLIAEAARRVPSMPYVFLYIIGSHRDAYRVALEKACAIGAKRVVLMTNGRAEWHLPELGLFRRIHVFTPADFLAHISSAAYVVTNSFHGTAFSVIFNRQFVSLRNQTPADCRMDTLLEVVRMGRLDEYRQLSMSFLKKALS